MSEEEKKAIERVENNFYKDLGKGISKFQKITLYENDITDIRTLLNLIDRLQKELEQEKFKRGYWEERVNDLEKEKNCVHKDKIRELKNKLDEFAYADIIEELEDLLKEN